MIGAVGGGVLGGGRGATRWRWRLFAVTNGGSDAEGARDGRRWRAVLFERTPALRNENPRALRRVSRASIFCREGPVRDRYCETGQWPSP